MAKKSWKIFWDLQCPYSKKSWENFPAIKSRFENEYDFTIHLTSLAFHPQAFQAQCAATLIKTYKGYNEMLKFVDACFESQESYMNAALGDCRKSEVEAVFADIAEKGGFFDDELTKEKFLSECGAWEKAVKPAYTEHKLAMGYGVYGTPKYVIEDKLVEDTESSWGPDEWAEKLNTITSESELPSAAKKQKL